MKAFRCPIHNIIYFDKKDEKLLLDLIDTKEFQRLRHINQLGLSSYTYPGATHTRFAHSLGVTHLMKRFIDKLTQLKDPIAKKYKTELKEHKMLALTSALLHDIGHGPLSHAIESVTGINHEKISNAIIGGNTSINEILESYKPGFSEEVINVIRRTHTNQIVVKLLSSQLDTDRIDYLLRDSIMTGAKYGVFDLEWLINVLRIGMYENTNTIEVGLDLDKGLSIAEDFVMARYYMYQHVYFHKTTRSAEVIVGKMINRVIELSKKGKLSLDPNLEKILLKSNKLISDEFLTSFLTLTDHTLWHFIYQWEKNGDEILQNLCKALLKRNLYKSIIAPQKTKSLEFYKKVFDIANREGVPPEHIHHEDTPATSSYKDNYISYSPKEDEQQAEKEASEQIILFDKDGKGFELSNKSKIIRQIRNEKLEVSRIYFPEKYKADLIGG